MSIERYFKKIKKAQASKRGRNFVPGVYHLTVRDAEFKESNNPQTAGDTFFIVSFDVDEFRSCDYLDHELGEIVSSDGIFKPGDDVAFRRNLDKMGGPEATKELAHALLCALDTECTLSEAEISAMLDDDNDTSFSDAYADGELVGLQIVNTVQNVRTKAGKNFAVSKWRAKNRL